MSLKRTKKPTRKKKITLSDMARSGGKATLKKHGKAHYRAIAKKRWADKPKSK